MIRSYSERLSGPSQPEQLRSVLSTASIASSGLYTGTLTSRRGSRSYTLSPPPRSIGHGRRSSSRRFSSRHVPAAAEDLAAHSQVINRQVESRFDGLMKHLKRNTERQDFEKQVLASPPEVLVPDEYDEILRAEFCRRCSFGERLNTELMHSGKWVKMLRELGLMRTKSTSRGPCLSTPAEADIIFRRALCDSDYGGKRLTYDYFCKALCLVAANVYPEKGWEDAMGELLALIAQHADENPPPPADHVDWSLDPNVLLQLDFFKPALHDLFRSFARRQLPGPTDARVGMGTTRLQERSIWKHTQDTMFASRNSTSMLGAGQDGLDSSESTPSNQAASPFDHQPQEDPASLLPAVQEGMVQNLGDSAALRRPPMNSEADAGGGYAESPGSSPNRAEPRGSPRSAGYPTGRPTIPGVPLAANGAASPSHTSPAPTRSPNKASVLAWAENKGWSIEQATSTMRSGKADTMQSVDPYSYANGSPSMKNRKRFMSLEQMFSMCKELKIVPDLVNRQTVVKVFKRAQCAGTASAHGGSNFGFLSQEAFVDAMGQIAIEAYKEEPYCDEYPQAHEKIHAFLMDKLPGHSRLLRDRFLYGCSGRGYPVQTGYLKAQ